MKRIAVLGSGIVGQVLADGFLKHGYEVTRASREPQKLADWQKSAGAKAHTATFADAAKSSDVVVLAVKGAAAESAIGDIAASLNGKIVIDATNPISESTPPTNGVLHYFTGPNESLMERLQKKAPGASFVKAFSSVGNAFFVNPDFGSTKPSMFICGNDAKAKSAVREILTQFGWETEDMGAVEAARAIEPLCMLWCIPGMIGGGWGHAFKLLHK
jgi:predicted dinucleotide-binding enzyme